MDSDDAFALLVNRIQDGDEKAAQEFVETYGPGLQRAVRRALNKRLRTKFDSLDFMQIVWSSVFRIRANLDRFEKPEELAAFLVKVATNKVGMETRRHLMSKKYNLNREMPLGKVNADMESGMHAKVAEPPEILISEEQLNRLIEGLPENRRQMVRMRLQGFNNEDIARQLGLAPSTVCRAFQQILEKKL